MISLIERVIQAAIEVYVEPKVSITFDAKSVLAHFAGDSGERQKLIRGSQQKALKEVQAARPELEKQGLVGPLSHEEMEGVYSQAHGFFTAQGYEDAARIFSVLFLHQPEEYRFSYGMARVMQMMNFSSLAIDLFAVAQATDYVSPIPSYCMAECALERGDPLNALLALESVVILSKENPQYAEVKARAFSEFNNIIKQVSGL